MIRANLINIYPNIEKDSHLVDLLLSPLKRVHNMTSELFQSGGGVEHLKNLKVKESNLYILSNAGIPRFTLLMWGLKNKTVEAKTS